MTDFLTFQRIISVYGLARDYMRYSDKAQNKAYLKKDIHFSLWMVSKKFNPTL